MRAAAAVRESVSPAVAVAVEESEEPLALVPGQLVVEHLHRAVELVPVQRAWFGLGVGLGVGGGVWAWLGVRVLVRVRGGVGVRVLVRARGGWG